MNRKMFCFQCEQTAGCSACTGNAGVCGKKADTARLQDKLTGALVGLAKAAEGHEDRIAEATETLDFYRWLYTALTRARQQVYLINWVNPDTTDEA